MYDEVSFSRDVIARFPSFSQLRESKNQLHLQMGLWLGRCMTHWIATICLWLKTYLVFWSTSSSTHGPFPRSQPRLCNHLSSLVNCCARIGDATLWIKCPSGLSKSFGKRAISTIFHLKARKTGLSSTDSHMTITRLSRTWPLARHLGPGRLEWPS